MKCEGVTDQGVECDNDARYLDEHGQFMCGTCPIKYGADALKFEDVGRLISAVREILDGGFMGGSSFERLRAIMGAKPEGVVWPVFDEPERCCDKGCQREAGHEGSHRLRLWDGSIEIVEEW